MAEEEVFGLRLDERISAAARKATDELQRLDKRAEKAAGELRKLDSSLSDKRSKSLGMQLAKQLDREEARMKKHVGFMGGLGRGVFAWAGPQGANRVLSHATGELLADSIKEGFVKGTEIVKEGLKLAFEGVKEAFKAGMGEQRIRLGYRLSLGARGGKESLEDVERFSKLTGVREDVAKGSVLQLRRAGFDQEYARTAFALATDVAAGRGMGGDEGTIASVIEQFERIMLKGGVGQKQLIGLGVNTKEFYKTLGKDLHVSPETAKKRAESGQLDPRLLFNAVQKGIEKTQGGRAGTGGIEFGKTLEGRLVKLRELPEQFLEKLAGSPTWSRVEAKLGGVLEAFDPESERGQRISRALESAFSKVGDAIETALRPENVEMFTDGIVRAIEATGGLIESLNSVIDLLSGETLSKALFRGDETDEKLRSLLTARRGVEGMAPGGDKARFEQVVAKREAALTPSERADYERLQGKPSSAGDQKPIERIPSIAAARGYDVPTEVQARTMGRPAAPKGGGTVHVAKMEFNVHPAKDDTAHSKQTFGDDMYRETLNQLERANQQGGG